VTEQLPVPPIALVVGLCSHGLAMVRALDQCGAEVHAFETKKNIPGVSTKLARIHYVESIKSQELIADLLAFRATISKEIAVVLFCTNDDNVAIVGRGIEQLKSHFEISWAHCQQDVLSLLLKSNIERQCQNQRLRYPKSKTLQSPSDIRAISNELSYPFIVKPIRPQSGFKVVKVNSEYELEAVVNRFEMDLPFLAQEWIAGGDESLFFGALYLDHGRVITSFVGQKLASHPPAMGQTTVAVSCDNDAVIAATTRFFTGLGLSGPVSLELKRDREGQLWVIEPTVGRTDFWVGLCVVGGCNLLELEFQHGAKQRFSSQQQRPAIWFDSARDAQAFFRYFHLLAPWSRQRKVASYSYWHRRDWIPFIISANKTALRVWNKLARGVRRSAETVVDDERYRVRVFADIQSIPNAYHDLFPKAGEEALFLGHYWFSKMVEHIGETAGKISVYGIESASAKPVALLPLWMKSSQSETNKVHSRRRVVSGMTNYYSPLFDAVYDVSEIDRSRVFYLILKHVFAHKSGCDALEFTPVHGAVKSDLELAAQWVGLPSLSRETTQNYYLARITSYDDFRRNLPSKLLHTIRRKANKIKQSSTLEISVSDGRDDLTALLEEYHHVYQKSWKIDEPFPEFISELALHCANKGWLRIGVLRIDEVAVAAQIWFVVGNTACIYKLAYREDYRSFSPGTLLTDKMMQYVIDVDRVRKVDFLTGSDPYKEDWMDSSRFMYNVVIPNVKNLSGLAMFVRYRLAVIRDRYFS